MHSNDLKERIEEKQLWRAETYFEDFVPPVQTLPQIFENLGKLQQILTSQSHKRMVRTYKDLSGGGGGGQMNKRFGSLTPQEHQWIRTKAELCKDSVNMLVYENFFKNLFQAYLRNMEIVV